MFSYDLTTSRLRPPLKLLKSVKVGNENLYKIRLKPIFLVFLQISLEKFGGFVPFLFQSELFFVVTMTFCFPTPLSINT
jgi:hypothetical protein